MGGKPNENDKKQWFNCLEERMTSYEDDKEEAESVCWEDSNFWFDSVFGVWRQGGKKPRDDESAMTTTTTTPIEMYGLDEKNVVTEVATKQIDHARNVTIDE